MKKTLRLLIPALIAALALLALPRVATVAQAQAVDPLIGIGQQVWEEKGSCRNCHGNMGNGDHEDPRAPIGANLRETTLTADQIIEVIKCGRPATGMPYFDRNAYTDTRCYGVTRDQLGASVPVTGSPLLSAREMQALAAFILADFVGHGDPTREQCQELWGAAASSCAKWPLAADLPAPAPAAGM